MCDECVDCAAMCVTCDLRVRVRVCEGSDGTVWHSNGCFGDGCFVCRICWQVRIQCSKSESLGSCEISQTRLCIDWLEKGFVQCWLHKAEHNL